MASQAAAAGSAHAAYNPWRLFILSCIALIASAMVFSIRANVMSDLGTQFSLNAETVGAAAGAAFIGLAFSIFIGSALLDVLGMGAILGIACVLHMIGLTVTIFTPNLTDYASAFTILYAGQLIVGIAHGLVEAAINPLAATIYPEDKTHKLNVLHAWWPGGLIIGGLLGYGLGKLPGVNWQWKLATIYVPALIYGFMLIGQKFPPTERKAAGVSTGSMWAEALKPMFIVWWLCMLLTAALELGPGQWVDAMLTRAVGFEGILILVYISAIMFVMRFFAGPLAHKLSPVGLMWLSSLLAGVGLFLLGNATSPVLALLAATVWGIGVCYMWPTMLAVTSERFPRGGALLMGLMGTAGMISIQFVLPWMGSIYDAATQKALPQGMALKEAMAMATSQPLVKQQLEAARTAASGVAFTTVSYLAIILVVVFALIWLSDRAKGGYRAERLDDEMLSQTDPADFTPGTVAGEPERT